MLSYLWTRLPLNRILFIRIFLPILFHEAEPVCKRFTAVMSAFVVNVSTIADADVIVVSTPFFSFMPNDGASCVGT